MGQCVCVELREGGWRKEKVTFHKKHQSSAPLHGLIKVTVYYSTFDLVAINFIPDTRRLKQCTVYHCRQQN